MGNKLIFRHPKQFARNAAILRKMIGILKRIKSKSVLGESSMLKYLRKLLSRCVSDFRTKLCCSNYAWHSVLKVNGV